MVFELQPLQGSFQEPAEAEGRQVRREAVEAAAELHSDHPTAVAATC